MASLESQLRRSLYRFDCPDAHTLGEYELGLLDPEQRISLATHANGCDDCLAELHTLRAFLATPTRVSESIGERTRRVVATLFAPAPGLAFGGLRGTAAETAPRVYEVEDITITLGHGQGPGTLIGLVMIVHISPEDLVGRPVRLIPRAGGALVSTLDDIGNFEFSDVAPDTYALELDLPGSVVVVVEELRVD